MVLLSLQSHRRLWPFLWGWKFSAQEMPWQGDSNFGQIELDCCNALCLTKSLQELQVGNAAQEMELAVAKEPSTPACRAGLPHSPHSPGEAMATERLEMALGPWLKCLTLLYVSWLAVRLVGHITEPAAAIWDAPQEQTAFLVAGTQGAPCRCWGHHSPGTCRRFCPVCSSCRSGMTLTYRELLIHAFPSSGIQRGESTTVPQWKQEWSCGYQPAAEQLSHFLTDFSPLGVSVVGTCVTCFSCQLQLYLCSLHGNTVTLALLCCCTTSWESSAVTRTGAPRSLLYIILAG